MRCTLFRYLISLLLFSFSLTPFAFADESASGPRPLDPVTLQLKWLHQFQFAGYYAAKEKGFYEEEGLDVSLQQRMPGISVIDEVVSGRAHFGVGGIGILARYAKGEPIRALETIFQHDALVLISKAESGIVSPFELRDKKVMFDATTGNDAVIQSMLDDAGLSPDDINVIPQNLGIDKLISGEIDAMSGYITDQPFLLRQKNININIINPHNYGFDFYGDMLFTSENEIRQNPARVERFRRASLKGWRYALEHPEEIIQIIKYQYGSASSIEQLRYEAKETKKLILPEVIPVGTTQISRLRRIADIYAKLGIAKPMDDKALKQFIHQGSDNVELTAQERRWLEQNPVIRVGVDRDFAPYEWINDKGEYQGLASEYIHLLESKLGVEFEIVANKPWTEILSMAYEGKLDMLSCVNTTPERAEHLNFTSPYISSPIVIVNAGRHGYVGSLDNLRGKTIAVEQGYFTYEMLKAEYPEIHILPAKTSLQALEMVVSGEADAYIGDAAYANFSIKKADMLNLQFAGQTHLNSSYRIGVTKSAPELLSIINKVLNNLSEAERKEIESQWLGLEINSGLSTRTLIQISVAGALVFMLFALWIYRLRQSKQAIQKSEEQLRAIIDASPIPHALNDADNNIVYINQAFTETFGYQLSDIPTLDDWWPKAYPQAAYRHQVINRWNRQLHLAQETNQKFEPLEVEIRCLNGQRRHILASATLVNRQADNKINSIVILYDITERKLAEERLKMSGRVFNQAHEGILITDARGVIVDVNPAFSEITGYSREEAVGKKPNILRSGKHNQTFYREIWNSLIESGFWHGEIWNLRKNGELFAEQLTISTLFDEHGDTLHYLGMFSDVTRNIEQQQALEMMAHYDMLTQLPNRTLFADRFDQAIAHSNRNHSLLAVVFLDLDGFKPVNDTYGHEVGDQILIQVAQRIKATIRQDDTASRLGGDEFVLLLNDVSSVDHCERLIKRIRHAIELPYKLDDDLISLSASLGITLYPTDHADADTLLRHADQSMYQAKMAGRGRHAFFDIHHDQQLSMQQDQLHAVQAGLKAGELLLYYQPKVNMRTGKVIGVEALLRWEHHTQGLLPPGLFLPAIQGTEFEIQLGNWVIDQALQQIEAWLAQGIELEISINISSHHIQWKGLFDQIERSLARHPKVPSHLLQLEILESSVMKDVNIISRIIHTFRSALGIRISLDDFGTGYSSLTHLRHLPVDVVKIDRSFVADIIDDPNDYTIVDGVIGLTESFHHQVIAEGVESEEHGLMLLTMGCQLAQGYGIAYPMHPTDFIDWYQDYVPNQSWMKHADHTLSAEQSIVYLMLIQGSYWCRKIINNLDAAPEQVEHWPLMNHKKSHFMHWFDQAKKQGLFSENWLESMKVSYIELFHEANTLKYQFQAGQVDIARNGIHGLKARYQIIEELFKSHIAEEQIEAFSPFNA